MKSWSILRELFFLLLFLGVLYAISFANRDVNRAHDMVNYLRHEFLKVQLNYKQLELSREKRQRYTYENMNSTETYWYWLENVFLPEYLQTRWSDNTGNMSRLYETNRANRILDWPTLRQLRVKNGIFLCNI